MSNVKHVYPNPRRPDICAILALAVYVFSTPRMRPSSTALSGANDTKLFEGRNQKSRWTDILTELVEGLPDDVDLGCKSSEGIPIYNYLACDFINIQQCFFHIA